MAAKMTDEEKQLRKKATWLRDRAYDARKKAYDAAMAEAMKEADPLKEAYVDANKARDAILERQRTEREAVEARIRNLHLELDGMRDRHKAESSSENESRKSLWHAYSARQEEIQARVDADFGDMKNVWSGAQWKSLEDFLPEAAAQSN